MKAVRLVNLIVQIPESMAGRVRKHDLRDKDVHLLGADWDSSVTVLEPPDAKADLLKQIHDLQMAINDAVVAHARDIANHGVENAEHKVLLADAEQKLRDTVVFYEKHASALTSVASRWHRKYEHTDRALNASVAETAHWKERGLTAERRLCALRIFGPRVIPMPPDFDYTPYRIS